MIEIVKTETKHVDGIVQRWIEMMDSHAAIDPHFTRAADGHVGFGKYVEEAITKPTTLVLVALDGPSVVGYALSMIANHPPPFARRTYGLVSDVAVMSTYRNQGIGTALTEKTIDWFRAQGTDRLELHVAAHNEIGMSFWKTQGFEEYMLVMYRNIGPKE